MWRPQAQLVCQCGCLGAVEKNNTENGPLRAVAADQRRRRLKRRGAEVEFFAFAVLRLEANVAALLVERKPACVNRAVSDRQSKLARPHARPV